LYIMIGLFAITCDFVTRRKFPNLNRTKFLTGGPV